MSKELLFKYDSSDDKSETNFIHVYSDGTYTAERVQSEPRYWKISNNVLYWRYSQDTNWIKAETKTFIDGFIKSYMNYLAEQELLDL